SIWPPYREGHRRAHRVDPPAPVEQLRSHGFRRIPETGGAVRRDRDIEHSDLEGHLVVKDRCLLRLGDRVRIARVDKKLHRRSEREEELPCRTGATWVLHRENDTQQGSAACYLKDAEEDAYPENANG